MILLRFERLSPEDCRTIGPFLAVGCNPNRCVPGPTMFPARMAIPENPPDRRERILAVAGIARPERFMDRLAERFQVVRREAFADHKSFSAADFKRWSRIIEADRLHAVVTTEKDAMRLPKTGVDGVPIRYEPMKAEWSNSSHFQAWLAKQLQDDTRSTVQNR